jgi:protoheme IX farnesyltransferase
MTQLVATDGEGRAAEAQAAGRRASWLDYLILTKPLIVALLLATTWAAMVVGAGGLPSFALSFWTLLGGGLTAAGARALNQYIDRDLDSLMARTLRRPLPAGRLDPERALVFGLVLCVLGVGILAVLVNPLSAFLAAVGAVYYVVAYSVLLKRATPQNIVIGGGAGAVPVLVGWAAATGALSMPGFLLFAVVFFWTPPHFWALALTRTKEYGDAGIPMLPVVYGEDEARRHVLLYSIQLVALTILIPGTRIVGPVFLVAALVLGGIFIWRSWRLWRSGGKRRAWSLYRYSSMYLALLFACMVLDVVLAGRA